MTGLGISELILIFVIGAICLIPVYIFYKIIAKASSSGRKKQYLFIILLIPVLFFLGQFTYFKFFNITVLPGNEAIVTKSGNIVGEPRKSGFHKINPFTQEAHHIERARLRIWTEDIRKDSSYLLRIYWNVDDSLTFYKKSQTHNVEYELENIFKTVKYFVENNYDQNTIQNLSDMKSKDWDFMDTNLKRIVDMTQENANEFGVNIHRIDFLDPQNINY